MNLSRATVHFRSRTLFLTGCVVVAAVAACGKKGPPLAPIVRLPAPVQNVTVARLGHDVYLTFALPTANVDRTTPVDLDHVDVYAYTGPMAPIRTLFVDQATRIAQVPVTPPPAEGQPVTAEIPASAAAGATVTILDRLPDQALPQDKRFYMVVAYSGRNRTGPPPMPIELPLTAVSSPPGGAAVTYSATTLTVTWMSPAAVAGAAASRVNVYRAPSGANPPAVGWPAVRPSPLNMSPLDAAPFTEPVAFGAERCYLLRHVTGEGPTATEGDSSAPVCVTPVDRFAPAAPAQLVAVATASGINLLWEANGDADLAGYLVLRGSVGDARLQPLTPMPITDVRFSDTTVASGMRYIYAVVAVDGQTPPNVSPESARVEETAQ